MTLQTVGPDAAGVRHRGCRRGSSCPESSPVTSISPSATPSPKPAPTSPRCGPAAVRAGDEYIVNGQKMWTTGGHEADFTGWPFGTDSVARQAQGHFDPDRRHQRSRLLLDADHPDRRRPPHERHLFRRRSGAGGYARRRGERRLAPDHHPAQSRARHPRPGRQDRGHLREGPCVGAEAGWQRCHPDRPR